MRNNYPRCYSAVRAYEGGNDDDPRDPGGRTSRGIIQREWDRYRSTHPGRPADVWKASEDDIAAIYKGDYWDAQWLDLAASGLDETQFDYGVNSGIGRSAKVLRRCLHMADNAPTADVRARLAELTAAQIKVLITAINDERLAFLKSLRTWPTFGKGWGARVASVKALSLSLATETVAAAAPQASPSIVPMPAPLEQPAGAKGQHEEPTKAKNAVATAGVGGVAVDLVGWIHSHPIEAGLAAAAIALAGGAAIVLINRAHKTKQEAPVPGWQPPAELKPA